jgi:hypothetical protein
MRCLWAYAIVIVVGATMAFAPSAARAIDAPSRPASLLCTVSVQRLHDLWDAMSTWAAGEREAGDALADAMAQSLADGDAEVVALQTENAGYYRDRVRSFRENGMRDDLKEIAHLGSVIASAAPGHRDFVKSRIASIRSLYKQYWRDAFAPTYIRGYEELEATNVTAWSALTDPLPGKAATAGRMFAKSFRGLPGAC